MESVINKSINFILYLNIFIFWLFGTWDSTNENLAGVVWDIFMIIISLVALQLINDKSTREGV
ncbi:hypothetical protein CD148_03355 [Staphylococcus delphini]|uniref:Phage protein n=1 Tax=Staphylococcus delphini TaxID=53344 RepID=A0AAX0QSK7_9STAP|nr:hypothetical protein B5C07_07815 [Staphylococcus delphini]PNZ95726.1 hypothetical protein CD148_03355 [Staphylococcus delphini]RIZ56263.1 hypothetical protein CDL68_01610 [Staphylococcus delphini]VED62495.1 Uncharacterised protein [Staphylococcus delphini]